MTKSRYICTCGIELSECAPRFTYAPLSAATCAVVGCAPSDAVSLLIPERDPDGRTVVAIGERAFSGMATLRTVTIPIR